MNVSISFTELQNVFAPDRKLIYVVSGANVTSCAALNAEGEVLTRYDLNTVVTEVDFLAHFTIAKKVNSIT